MFVWLGFGILFPILPLLIALVPGVIGTGMGVSHVIFRTKAEHLSKRHAAAQYSVATGNRR